MFRQFHIVLLVAAALVWAHANAAECKNANETDVICGSLCEATCGNATHAGFLCPPLICIRGITSGCRCNLGYSRNRSNNVCVLTSDCPK